MDTLAMIRHIAGTAHNLERGRDGAFFCRVCGCAEAHLTTECPGLLLTAEQALGVAAGCADFFAGGWRQRPLPLTKTAENPE